MQTAQGILAILFVGFAVFAMGLFKRPKLVPVPVAEAEVEPDLDLMWSEKLVQGFARDHLDLTGDPT